MPEEKQPEEKQSDKLIDLLQANLDRNEEILKISLEIKKYMRWQNFWATIRMLIIIAPIIIGFIYLPPLIKEYIASYQSLIN